MATKSGSVLCPNNKNHLQETEKTKASRLSQQYDDCSTSSEKNHEEYEVEYESNSSRSKKRDALRLSMRKTKKVGSFKQAKVAIEQFKKLCSNHSDLKEIRPSISSYKKCLAYLLHSSGGLSREHTSRETGMVNDFIKQMERPLCGHHFEGEELF